MCGTSRNKKKPILQMNERFEQKLSRINPPTAGKRLTMKGINLQYAIAFNVRR